MSQFELEGLQVLVVDDEPHTVEVINIALSSVGANVFVALDGERALEVFKEKQLTLVLTDLSMPALDGWQLLKEVRTHAK